MNEQSGIIKKITNRNNDFDTGSERNVGSRNKLQNNQNLV